MIKIIFKIKISFLCFENCKLRSIMISNSSKYAIKAVLYLAVNSNQQQKIMAKDIFEPINVPQAYIAKLLQLLVKKKLISSTKGPKGGFYLTNENRAQSIMKIINVIDGEQKFNTCMLSLKACDIANPCPLHKSISPAKSILVQNLQNKTINDLALDVKSGNAFLPL